MSPDLHQKETIWPMIPEWGKAEVFAPTHSTLEPNNPFSPDPIR